MDPTSDIAQILASTGPSVLFIIAFLETSFLTGLLVPCGPVIVAAVALAGDGVLDFGEVAAASIAGALAGDSVGYWVGRSGGEGALRTRGRLGRVARKVEPRARSLMGQYPAAGVTLARLLSFVRTLMPPVAGLSGLSYPRFLLWDLLGVALWASLYLGIGVAADDGWETLRRILGTGGALVFVLTLLSLYLLYRRKSS
jgi:membrane-associated protein